MSGSRSYGVAGGLRARGADATGQQDLVACGRPDVQVADREPYGRGDGAPGHQGAQRPEQQAARAHALLARVPEVEPHRECEPPQRHLHHWLERREHVPAHQIQHVRPEEEAQRDVLDPRW
jgi:hypothetical protein